MGRVRKFKVSENKAGERGGCFRFLAFCIRMCITLALVFALLSLISYFVIKRFVKVPEKPVPNIVGLSPGEALSLLSEENFTLSFEKYEYSRFLKEGRIVSQYPRGGVYAKIGTPVRVVLSKGFPLASVPDVRGDTEVAAGIKIRSAKLTVGSVCRIHHARVKKDSVISQDPPPRTGAPSQYPVKLLVSLGREKKKFLMPRLLELPLSRAREILNAQGISISEIRSAKASLPRDLVINQSPAPGSTIDLMQKIILTIASGENQVY